MNPEQPNQKPTPEPLYIKPRRHFQIRWIFAGIALLLLNLSILTQVFSGGKFQLIYSILFGVTLLIVIIWGIFTPAVLGLRKKK